MIHFDSDKSNPILFLPPPVLAHLHPPPVLILTEVDQLTKDAQHALRRTMEKYTATCRLILCCNSTSKVIDPIRSRCLGIRVPAPTLDEVSITLTLVNTCLQGPPIQMFHCPSSSLKEVPECPVYKELVCLKEVPGCPVYKDLVCLKEVPVCPVYKDLVCLNEVPECPVYKDLVCLEEVPECPVYKDLVCLKEVPVCPVYKDLVCLKEVPECPVYKDLVCLKEVLGCPAYSCVLCAGTDLSGAAVDVQEGGT